MITTGFTYPITASDKKPLNGFKTEMAKILRRMADNPNERNVSAERAALLKIADLFDNIIIEGE